MNLLHLLIFIILPDNLRNIYHLYSLPFHTVYQIVFMKVHPRKYEQ